MDAFCYPASLRRQADGRVLVSYPDFPNVYTDGADRAEAMEEAIDCLGTVLADRIARKQEIPEPSPLKRGQQLVPAPFWVAGKLALYVAMKSAAVSNSELARRLGVRENVVRRMLDPDHDTSFEKIQAALRVMGKRAVVTIQDAA